MQEAVIIDAVRSPIGKKKGSLSGLHPSELLAQVLKQLIERNGVDPAQIDDVIMGCVSQAGEQSGNIARYAWLTAGFPESVPGTTIDRQCGSSLQALQFAAQGVMAGGYKLVIAGGVESMSRVPIGSGWIEGQSPLTETFNKRYNGAPVSQYAGAEIIAKEIGMNRKEQDEYSYQSHQRAHAAREEGRFENEIVPIAIQGGEGETMVFRKDETIRSDTSIEKISSLKSPFPGLEMITAGNSSQISDGASAILVADKETAKKLGLKPRARFVSFAVVGDDPIAMLKGPIPATKKALAEAGLSFDDIDLVEINEAFASVVLRWQKEIGISLDKVNVNGGAIALGHPLGATGGRLIATLLNELERRQERYGLVTICEGGGMANAMIIERLD